MENKHKTILCFLFVFTILSSSTMLLLHLYILPSLDGMNLVNDYLQSTSDNMYLDIIGYNEEQIVSDFKTKIIETSQDESLSVDQAVNVLLNDIDNTQTGLFDKLYAVIIYQFSPLISMLAVVFLHIKIQIWVCGKALKLFKINLASQTNTKVMGK